MGILNGKTDFDAAKYPTLARAFSIAQPAVAFAEEDTKALSYQVGFEQYLPYAAEALDISKNLRDYFLVPVPIIYSDLPNRNGVAIPRSALLAWNEDLHCCAYQGWKGCPVYREHDWGDPKRGRKAISYGIIADVTLKPMKRCPDILRVIALLAIDRTKNVELGRKIESGSLNSYSMGCLVSNYTCSICGQDLGFCMHLNPDQPFDFRVDRQGQLVYRLAHGIHPVETSIVSDPAYQSAINDPIFKYS